MPSDAALKSVKNPKKSGSTCATTLLHTDRRAHPWVDATLELVHTGGQSRDLHRGTLRHHHQVSWVQWALWRSDQWIKWRNSRWGGDAVQKRNGSSAVGRHLCKCVALAAAVGHTEGLSGSDVEI